MGQLLVILDAEDYQQDEFISDFFSASLGSSFDKEACNRVETLKGILKDLEEPLLNAKETGEHIQVKFLNDTNEFCADLLDSWLRGTFV